LYLFSFEYFRNYLYETGDNEGGGGGATGGTAADAMQSGASSSGGGERRKEKSKHIGRGHKKALIRWYNSKSEFELLSLLTKHKHSHSWTNKDLFKLIHFKPKNEGKYSWLFIN
jgi:hypothetical protein